MPDPYKIAITGAASLRGKELNEILADSSFGAAEFLLMDDEAALGQLEAVGDEAAFVQRIEPDSFERVDFAFFAGDEELTRKHWQAATRAGASIIDLSGALEGEANVLVRAPWVQDELLREEADGSTAPAPDLHTPAIVSAHPAALALGLLLLRARDVAAVRSATATVLEPASEYGRAAIDELHQQTVGLLNFQGLPKDIYDTQIAFNLLPVLGEAAKVNLPATEARIRGHYTLISGGHLPEVGIQLLHAPVFHGYTISLALELEQAVSLEHLEAALSGEHIDIMLGDADAPSNLSCAGEEEILVRARTEQGVETATNRFWIWAAVDNLKLTALNAVACAIELRKLRPQGKVQ